MLTATSESLKSHSGLSPAGLSHHTLAFPLAFSIRNAHVWRFCSLANRHLHPIIKDLIPARIANAVVAKVATHLNGSIGSAAIVRGGDV